jgi:flavin-dependent dehydrogenase
VRKTIYILGGGPAGASAALAAQREGSPVCLIEKSKFPRHRVCGEFFSPEIAPALEQLGAWDAFQSAGPARVRRIKLNFGRRQKTSRLPECAWGLSRSAFDALLLGRAQAQDAELIRESNGAPPLVIASGRNASRPVAPGKNRLFGFKAHFEGPTDDAVELFFFDGCYVGVNPVEGGRTNVCGLGPEDFLRGHAFDYDRVAQQSPALAERLEPLTRSMKWLSTGPLRYGQNFSLEGNPGQYPAGDALAFADPFTGSGLVAAVKTGAMAGAAAARGEPVPAYLARCRNALKKPFEIASILRATVESGWADRLSPLLPARILFALTRPQ